MSESSDYRENSGSGVSLSELHRRVYRVERRVDNGYFVRRDEFESTIHEIYRRFDNVEKDLKWMLRGITAALLTVLLQAAVLLTTFLIQSGAT